MAAGSRGSSIQEPVTRGSSRGLPVPAPPAGRRELLRAKRKLLFKGNVFEGERFYLDLDGYSNTKQLETDLYEMGALVERFFNNQVTKIITNKKESNHARSNSTSSNLSRLSSTRAAALLNKSIGSGKTCDKTSIQEKAKKMGIKILQLKVVVDIISREKEKCVKPEDILNEVKSCPMSAPRARKLKAPYIKVEDSSCKYRPVCSNFTKFPLIDLSNIKPTVKAAKELPVPKLDIGKENQGTKHSQSNATNKVSIETKVKDSNKPKDDSKSKTAKRAQAVKAKNGYCEICDAVYSDLKLHTKSESHGKIVGKKEYWSTLDDVINTLPSLGSLIANVNGEQNVSQSQVPESKQSFLAKEEMSHCRKSNHSSQDVQNCCDKVNFVCNAKDTMNNKNRPKNTGEIEVQNVDMEMRNGELVMQCVDVDNVHNIQSENLSEFTSQSNKSGQKNITIEAVNVTVNSATGENLARAAVNSQLVTQYKSETRQEPENSESQDICTTKVVKSGETNKDSLQEAHLSNICFSDISEDLNFNLLSEQTGGFKYSDISEFEPTGVDACSTANVDVSLLTNCSAAGKGDATMSINMHGSDHTVAKEIEDGLEALLECAKIVSHQIQSQTSAEQSEKAIIIQSDQDTSSIARPVCGGNNELNNNPEHGTVSSDIVSVLSRGASDGKASVTNLKVSDLEKEDGPLLVKNNIRSSQTEQNEGENGDKTSKSREDFAVSSQTEDVSERNVFGASEISNENYIFSSLSLVDNEYLNDAALNELNQDGLTVLSEITEKYAANPSLSSLGQSRSTSDENKNSHQHRNEHLLPSKDQLHNLNTVSVARQPILSSQLNQISSSVMREETVLPMDQYYVKAALEKTNVSEKDFSDFSEASAVDDGLPCDTYLTIMHALDHSEVSRSPKVPLRCKKTQAVQSVPAACNSKAACSAIDLQYLKTGAQAKIEPKSKDITKSPVVLTNTVTTVLEEVKNKEDRVMQHNDIMRNEKVGIVNGFKNNGASDLLPVEKKVSGCKTLVSESEHLDENCNVTKCETGAEPESDSVHMEFSDISSATCGTDSSQSCDTNSVQSIEEHSISSSDVSDHEETLCYGDSSGCESDMNPTPTKDTEGSGNCSSASSIGSSETEAQAFLVRSSSLPHNEDACDGISDCPTYYDAQSTGGSYHSNLDKQVNMGTEQSVSLGYHSYSPFEDSVESDILPLTPAAENISRSENNKNTFTSTSTNLPKPILHQRKPIRLKINLKNKKCTILNEHKSDQDLTDSSSRTYGENINTGNVMRNHFSDSRSAGVWVATPPTGLKLKLKLTNAQDRPKTQFGSPLNRVQNTPKSCVNSPTSDSNWSVHRSGGLKLKFSSSKFRQETLSCKLIGFKPSTPTHNMEHSPPSDGAGRPNKRRRKLTYEPGTLRW